MQTWWENICTIYKYISYILRHISYILKYISLIHQLPVFFGIVQQQDGQKFGNCAKIDGQTTRTPVSSKIFGLASILVRATTLIINANFVNKSISIFNMIDVKFPQKPEECVITPCFATKQEFASDISRSWIWRVRIIKQLEDKVQILDTC